MYKIDNQSIIDLARAMDNVLAIIDKRDKQEREDKLFAEFLCGICSNPLRDEEK